MANRESKKAKEQRLKDELWAMVRTLDLSNDVESSAPSIGEIEEIDDYQRWEDEVRKLGAPRFEIPAFRVSALGLRKIRDEWDQSCLSGEDRDVVEKAIKAAKVVAR